MTSHLFISPRRIALVAIAVLTALAVLAPITPARATDPVGHTTVVPETPRLDTPRIDNGTIEDIVQWGNRIVLVGNFTQVENANGQTFNQPYIVAYNINTGLVDTSFSPQFDRPVNAAVVSPDGQNLYVAGLFNNVNGVGRRKVAKLNQNGSLDLQFQADANSRASALAISSDGDTLYVGGFFARVNGVNRGLLAAVDADTGAVDPGLDLPITEGLGANATLKVQSLLLTPDDNTLIVVHTGNRVDGQLRQGVALINTNTGQLRPWQTDLYTDNLPRVGGVLRITEGDISPDGTYFVVVSGSGGDRPPINDTAIAWPVAGGAGVEPLWVSRHFDSLFSVVITEVAVYIGGHFRWQEAPGSTDPWPGDDFTNYGWDAGIGAYALGDEVVRRDQIGALDPATGKSLNWNPGSNANVGVLAMEAVERGLLISHDATFIGGYNVGYHGFLDFDSIPDPVGPQTNIDDPFNGVRVTDSTFEVVGDAFAEGGINRVQIEVRLNGPNTQLQDDLVTFAPNWNGIDVTVDDPGAESSTWRQELSLPSGEYRIQAKTFGLNGDSDQTKAVVNFEVNISADDPPTTEITYPSFFGPPPTSNTFIITGTAADDIGVASVRMTIHDPDTGEYIQDDFSVSTAYNAFTVPVDPPGGQVVNWEFEVTVPNGTWRIAANATDTSGQQDNAFVRSQVTIDPTNSEPTVTLDSPPPFTVFDANTSTTLSGSAADDTAVDTVRLNVRNLQTGFGIQANGNYGVLPMFGGGVEATITSGAGTTNATWELVTPSLPPGQYLVQVWAEDNQGTRTNPLFRPTSFITASVPGDAEPDTTLDQEGYDQDRDLLGVNLSGGATDDVGVDRVVVTIQETYQREFLQGRRYVTAAGTYDPAYTEIDAVLSGPPTNRTWSLSGITLPESGDYTIVVKALDTAGQYDIDQTGATAQWLIWPGDTDPYTWIQGPNEGDNVPAGSVIINGRSFDDLVPFCSPGLDCGIDRVDLQIRNSAGEYMNFLGLFTPDESWVPVFLTNPGGQFSNWSYATPPLPDDAYTIRARATDLRFQIDQEVNPFPAAPGQEPDFINITVGTGSPVDNPQLSLSSSATPDTFTAQGETIAEAFVLTNTGNVALAGPFTVTSDQPADPISCPGTGTLAVGASITCTASNFITNAEFNAGQSVTVAQGAGSFNGGAVTSNQSTLTVLYDDPGPGVVTEFRAASSTSGNRVNHNVGVPGSVEAGDLLLLFVSVNNATEPVSVPGGWTLLDSQADGSMHTEVYTRIATGGDAGSNVTVTLGSRKKADVVLAAYSGVNGASPILGHSVAGQAGSSTTHTTPGLATGGDALIVSYWGEKNSSTTSMTTGAGVTRHANSMTGGGAITALLIDGGSAVPAGTYGGLVATADAASGRATMWTIALNPE